MSALDPEAPSQPTQQTGLNQAQNPASKTSEENSTSKDVSSTQSQTIDHRQPHDVPQSHGEEANCQLLASGETGPLTERSIPESDAQNYAEGDSNLEGEQMRMAGEGEVAEAVRSGGGGGHAEERSLTQNIDAKAAEHEAELHRRGERTGKRLKRRKRKIGRAKRLTLLAHYTRDEKIAMKLIGRQWYWLRKVRQAKTV